MPRPAPDKPTDVELQILTVLWDRGPSTVREVHDDLARRVGWVLVHSVWQLTAVATAAWAALALLRSHRPAARYAVACAAMAVMWVPLGGCLRTAT